MGLVHVAETCYVISLAYFSTTEESIQLTLTPIKTYCIMVVEPKDQLIAQLDKK